MADKIIKNFDAHLVDLDGEALMESKISTDENGKSIETLIVSPPINKLIARALKEWFVKDGDDPIQLYEWALLLNKGGDISLQRDDYNQIKEIVKKQYSIVLVQAQIVKILDA